MLNSALLNPGSIAIVGASTKTDKPGSRLVTNLIEGGYKGNIYPVNPKENEIQGLKCYNTLDQLPNVDLAILALHPVQCVEAVDKLSKDKETKAFIIVSAGFGETSPEGRALEQELRELATARELAIIGPNCIGVMNTNYQAIFVCSMPAVREGAVDYVSASGAFAVFLFELANKQGLRFGSVYSVGNSVTIGVEEVLQFWDEHYVPGKSGRVKLVYAEQIRKPEMFYRHIHGLRRKGCHVVVLKPGDSEAGARAALSHTGALAGDKEACDYLIRKAGAIRCYSREELVYLANILSQDQLQGKNLAIITHAGGPAVMLTDQLQKAGFQVPELDARAREKLLATLYPGSSAMNPIDMLATGNREQLDFCIRLCDTLDYIDGTIIIYGKTGLENLFETYTTVHDAIEACHKPVYAVVPSIHTGAKEIAHFIHLGHPAYFDEILLAECLGKVLHTPEPYSEEISIPENLVTPTTFRVLDEAEVIRRLEACDIPYVKTLTVRTPEELQSMTHIPFPVVAKVMGILHKTEHEGVVLNISDRDQLKRAFTQLMAIKGATGILVQEMLDGLELFLGAKKHAGIGWSVHAGAGGIFIELLDDRASTLAPVSLEEARNLLSGLKAQKLFTGFRNLPAADRDAFARLLVSFSQIVVKFPDIAEIDINPLLAKGDRIVAVDARIITENSHPKN